MRAFILAGGLGTRLRPVIDDVPKSMAPIREKPFLEYQLHWLKRRGITEIVLCTGYLGGEIEAYFGDGGTFGVHLFHSKEDAPAGTAGALKNAARYVDDTFLALNGDTLLSLELPPLVSFHRQKKGAATLVLAPAGDPGSCGRVTADQEGKAITFSEKKSTCFGGAHVNAGIYLMEPEILQYIPANRQVSLELEIFPFLAEKNRLFAFLVNNSFIDIGTPTNYKRAQKEIWRSIISEEIRERPGVQR